MCCPFTAVHFSNCMCPDPMLWSEWEVNHWLDWCQAEFGLHCLGSDLRGLQGSQLCSLDRETFLGLMSDCTAGEILWEHLETMRRGKDILQPASGYLFFKLEALFQQVSVCPVFCFSTKSCQFLSCENQTRLHQFDCTDSALTTNTNV